MTDLFVDSWGVGTRVVLVHGSLATGPEEWQAQRPLAGMGYQLLVLDRRGYGRSPAAEGEDFLRDADDIAEIIGDGAHVVAHSYGGLGAMFAASQRPGAIRSLAVLEPPVSALTSEAARNFVDAIRSIWDEDVPDEEWLTRFLDSVGTDINTLPAEVVDEAVPLVPTLRNGRPVWDREPPFRALATAPFPKLVVSGGHSDGFEAICDELAHRIGAARAVIEGAGHEIQFTGAPINDALLGLWASAEQQR